MRAPRSLRGLAAVGGVVLAGCLSSCVQIPTAGPVVSVDARGETNPEEPPFSQPRPPQPGDTPEQIVQGFLNAMTAVPVQTTAARQFLTRDAAARWKPQHGVYIYDPPTTPRGSATVTVRLRGGHEIGPRGNWRGRLPAAQARLSLPVQLVGKEYRIAQVPDALVVPRNYFEQIYQRVALDFFDPTGRILVPELVYLPSGDQLAGALVRGLLQGPSPSVTGVVRTFVPPGLTTAQLSVPVQRGVAELNLKGADPGVLSPKTTQLMVAQLAATLGQDPSISSFRVSIDGRQVADPAGASTFRAVSQQAYDPSAPLASGSLYGIKHGLLVSGLVKSPSPAQGPFGTERRGIRSFAVNLDSTTVAAATSSSLLVGPIQSNGAPATVRTVISDATGLLKPAYDFAGRIWEIMDDPRGGAEVVCVRHDHVHRVKVPGISGQPVKRFLVSRDGSRLVAVIRGRKADRIAVSRLRYDAAGRPVGATKARPIPWQSGGVPRIRDIGWTSPTTIAVLHLANASFSEVRTVAVDGSTRASDSTGNILAGRVSALVTSPSVTANPTSFAIQGSTLVDLSQLDPVPNVSIPHLHDITFAG